MKRHTTTQPLTLSDASGLRLRVRKHFGPEQEPDFVLDASFTAPAGFTAVFGPSGCGKTTLLDCIAGLQQPNYGFIALGECVLFDSDRSLSMPVQERRVGYAFQRPSLFPHLTVAENVAYGLFALPRTQRERRVFAMLESMHIAEMAKRRPSEISGGQRQRVALARALVIEPSVLLLDEPLTGLDAKTKSRIMDDLCAWVESHQVPALYVSHHRDEVVSIAQRVIVLEEGRVIASGSPQDVLEAHVPPVPSYFAGFENAFEAEVISVHPELGTMRCRVNGSAIELEVPFARFEPSAPVRIVLRAGDILIACSEPHGISARNVLKGTVAELRRLDVLSEVVVHVDGTQWIVHITPGAQQSLSLAPGMAIWLVIKTHALRLARID